MILSLKYWYGCTIIKHFIYMLSETQPPEIIQGQSVAKIEVPAEAANSVVGFENTLITVNEGMFFFK